LTIGHATAVVSLCVLVFLALIVFVFWLAGFDRSQELPARASATGRVA
jgi:hypothetical protein